MSNKSFSEIIKSLNSEAYKFTFFDVVNIGEYFPEDVDWNDKDVILCPWHNRKIFP